MARIEGVDLPRNKRIEIALTYIYGIGRTTARRIVAKAKVDPAVRSQDLSEVEVAAIREAIQQGYTAKVKQPNGEYTAEHQDYTVEGELRKKVAMNIKRLIDVNAYRGLRHKRGLPTRGQRTHTNARTRKGPRRAISRRK